MPHKGSYSHLSVGSKTKGRISSKISKVMKEGVRGKKVGHKQAVAVAYNMMGLSKKGKKK